MTLPEDDAEDFERIVQWLYCKNFELPPFTGERCREDRNCFIKLAKLYVVADKYGIVHLKNKVMDQWCNLRTRTRQKPCMTVVNYIYENTMPPSKLRDAIVAEYAWNIHFDFYPVKTSRYALQENPEFAVDLVVAMSGRIQHDETNPFHLGSIRFHDTVLGIEGVSENREESRSEARGLNGTKPTLNFKCYAPLLEVQGTANSP